MSQILMPYYLFLNNITPPFTLEYLSNKNQLLKTIISKGVDFQTSFSLSSPNRNKPPYSFRIINNKTGYIDFVSMTGNYQDFDKFLDSAFTVMRKNNIKTLAIDLRKNSGGNSLLGELLLSYITRKPFSLMGERYWKISAQYKDYLRSRGDTTNEYLRKQVGDIWRSGKCGAREQKFRVDSVFTGHVFFLTGPFTFSSANMLADGVKRHKLATIVGESTGESTNDFGEAFQIELPNTKIKVQLTTSYDIGVDCKKDHSLPVVPDKIIRTTVKDKINNLDSVLEYVVRQAK